MSYMLRSQVNLLLIGRAPLTEVAWSLPVSKCEIICLDLCHPDQWYRELNDVHASDLIYSATESINIHSAPLRQSSAFI